MTGKTIVYLPNWLGDMVMATPFLRSLREGLQGELWAFGNSRAMHLYNGLSLFERFIPHDNKHPVTFLDNVTKLRTLNFARGVILPHSFRSALLFFLGAMGERIGYGKNKRSPLLTRVLPVAREAEPTVEHYLKIIDDLGGARITETPFLTVTEDEEQKFDEAYMDIVGGPYAAFIVGAQYGPSKRWPESHFSALADMLVSEYDLGVYLLPTPDEVGIAQKVYEGVKQKSRVTVKVMGLRDLKVCLSQAQVVVSNDTGPRHISVALSRPTVVLLGPMDDVYTRYPSPFTHLVTADVDCRPCNRKKCDRDHACLKGIRPERVLDAIKEILRDTDAPAH
jgi:heptosyltransferase II